MAIPILVIGRSGSGKSASMRNLQNSFVINVTRKSMPFKHNDSLKIYNCEDYSKIKESLLQAQKNNYKTCIIDDAGYLITNAFMRKHSSANKGNQTYELYNELADDYWKLLFFIRNELSEDMTVYVMMHEETNENTGEVKPKTIGRLLNEKICIEGLFTIVLHAMKSDGKYIFKTNTDGADCAKSPIDMFPEIIDNDLEKVDKIIRDYYSI